MEIFKKLLVVIAIFCILHKDGIFAENIKLEDEKNDDTKNHENKKITILRTDKAIPENKIFIATKEWQDVPNDMGIPQGLHIRLNIQTGRTEAKLLDDKDKVGIQPSALIATKQPEEEKVKKISETKVKATKVPPKITVKEQLDAKYESLKKLKQRFEKARERVKSEFEILDDIYVNYKMTANVDEEQHLISINDIEHYLHQFDNAIYFGSLGGYKIALMDLNSTSIKIQIETLRLIGTALQGNPKARDLLLKNPLAIQRIVQLLTLTDTPFSSQFNHNTNYEILRRKRALFALSAVVRGHAVSQQLLYNIGAFQSMMYIFEIKNSQISIKLITFLTDIISEQIEISKGSESSYRIALEQLLNKSVVWCNTLSRLLADNKDHDDNEKVLKALEIGTQENICDLRDFNEILRKTKTFYEDTYKQDDDPYFKMLLDVCTNLFNISNDNKQEL